MESKNISPETKVSPATHEDENVGGDETEEMKDDEEHEENEDGEGDELRTVCVNCGQTELEVKPFELNELGDEEKTGDCDECPDCSKRGPFCERCILHHLLHCRGTGDEEEVEFDPDCSDCEEAEAEDDEYEDDGFVILDK